MKNYLKEVSFYTFEEDFWKKVKEAYIYFSREVDYDKYIHHDLTDVLLDALYIVKKESKNTNDWKIVLDDLDAAYFLAKKYYPYSPKNKYNVVILKLEDEIRKNVSF